ncbi:MAG TPA: imidazole glycerol phosphate synthase subunit HisH [Candidatus Ornithoclostridium faecavium]|nr:imidazole glycerol phosphate synthase subunit HisH [Candidatus Ornithoclostridium faecavium]
MIAIVDYGMGNLRSVQKAFEYLGYDAAITDQSKALENASHIVLPGVGAFRDAIAALKAKDLDGMIKKEVAEGKPFLGICLGMQMLFDRSLEDGEYEGLGLIGGEVVRFDTDLKIPHIGWNTLYYNKRTALFDGIDDNFFYFVHSYHAAKVAKEDIETTCVYGYEFVASVNRDNVWGVQFHPEKSGDTGLKVLKNFGAIK